MLKRVVRTILAVVGAVIVLAGLGILVVATTPKSPPPVPDFDRVLNLSGLPFTVRPQVLQWKTTDFGAWDIDEATNIEFKLDEADAASFQDCKEAGYEKQKYGSWCAIIQCSKNPRGEDEICKRRFNDKHGSTHTFMIYNGLLIYEYVHL